MASKVKNQLIKLCRISTTRRENSRNEREIMKIQRIQMKVIAKN
jgi:hypothetical protein